MDEATGLPISFGRAVQHSNKAQEARERIAKSRRVQEPVASTSTIQPTRAVASDNEDEGDAEDGEGPAEDSFDLPVSHEVVLKDHTKVSSGHYSHAWNNLKKCCNIDRLGTIDRPCWCSNSIRRL